MRQTYFWSVAWAIAIVTTATHILGATLLLVPLWSAHLYAFLPSGSLTLSCACLLAGIVATVVGHRWLDAALVRLGGVKRSTRVPWVWHTLTAALFFAMFWSFREGHTLLGDGSPLAQNLPRGQRFHPDEPLTLFVHQQFYRLFHRFFESASRDPSDVAHDTVGLSSALAGALLIPVVWGLARELARNARTGEHDEQSSTNPSLIPLFFFLLLAQGYIELFFGYVENYTFYTLVMACYALAVLRFLRGRVPLLVAGTALVLALALHLAAAVLLPSFLVVAIYALARRDLRAGAVRDLVLTGVLFALTSWALSPLSPGYSLAGKLVGVVSATNPESSYGFTRPTLLAFLNEQLLIGPVGVFLFLPAAWAALKRAGWREVRTLFVLAMGIAYLAASCIAGSSNLGDARNWDLLAPAGFVFTFAGLDLAARATWGLSDLRRWLLLLLVVSLFHTVPWVAVNASFDRSFARFKTLPLGMGRTQATVGYWYLRMGQEEEAIRWFRLSLDENPRNNLAAYHLGRIAMSRHDYDFAAQAFGAALQVRPGTEAYRFGLADALLRAGHPQWAKLHLDTLLMRNPGEPVYWVGYAVAWLGLGKQDSAESALGRARLLAPKNVLLDSLLLHSGRADSYARALHTDWPAISKQ